MPTHVVLLVIKTTLYKHKGIRPAAPVTFRVAALVTHWKTKQKNSKYLTPHKQIPSLNWDS